MQIDFCGLLLVLAHVVWFPCLLGYLWLRAGHCPENLVWLILRDLINTPSSRQVFHCFHQAPITLAHESAPNQMQSMGFLTHPEYRCPWCNSFLCPQLVRTMVLSLSFSVFSVPRAPYFWFTFTLRVYLSGDPLHWGKGPLLHSSTGVGPEL